MRLSIKTLRAVAEVITGDPREDVPPSPYQTHAQIEAFFRHYGPPNLSVGGTSRFTYTLAALEAVNGTDVIPRIICGALDFWGEGPDYKPEAVAERLNERLRRDGFELTFAYAGERMEGGKIIAYGEHFELRPMRSAVVEVSMLANATEASINEQVKKARKRIEAGDHGAAITTAYTLVEAVLKDLCRQHGAAFGTEEGDIRALYKLLREPLHLDPAADGLAPVLKPILTGLQSQLAGLYEVANKAGDRHVGGHRPAARHARLAVNAAFTLCDFLVASHQDQAAREAAKKAS